MVVTDFLKKVTVLLNLLLYLIISIKFIKLVIEAVNMWITTNSLGVLLPHFF